MKGKIVFRCFGIAILLSIMLLLAGCSDDDKATSSGPFLSVVAVNPANGSIRVPLNQVISVEFSDTLDCALADSTWLTIDGSVTGNLACSDNMLTFTPSTDLELNIDYRIALSPDIVDISGIKLGGDYNWSFKSFDGTGEIWHKSPDSTVGYVNDVVWGGGRFVAVGYGSDWYLGAIYSSHDGINWTAVDESWPITLFGITYFDDQFFATGDNGTIMASSNGIAWEEKHSDSMAWYKDIACSNEMIVALGNDHVLKSENGNSWERFELPYDHLLSSISWLGSQFMITADGIGNIIMMSSLNGEQWDLISLSGAHNDDYLYCIAASDTRMVACGRYGTVISTTNGSLWVIGDFGIPANEEVFIRDITWDGYQLVAVGGSHLAWGGFIVTSPDGSDWEYRPYFSDGIEFSAVAWSGEKLVAFLAESTITPFVDCRIYYSP